MSIRQSRISKKASTVFPDEVELKNEYKFSTSLQDGDTLLAAILGTDEPPPPEPEPVTENKNKKKKKLTPEEKKALAEAKEREKIPVDRDVVLSPEYDEKFKNAMDELFSEVRMRELGLELADWGEKIDRWFKTKDQQIVRLQEHIAFCREMNMKAHCRRIHLIDHLAVAFKALMESARCSYEVNIDEIMKNYYMHGHEMDVYADMHRTRTDNILNCTNANLSREMYSDYEIFLTRYYRVISEEIEERYMRRDQIVQKMQTLRKTLCDFVNYLGETTMEKEKFEHLQSMMRKASACASEADRLNAVELKYQTRVNTLQRNMVRLEITNRKRLNDLRIEQSFYLRMRKRIAMRIESENEMTFAKMKVLSNCSHEVIKGLKESVEGGELLMSLLSKARKLETQAEKILPYGEFPCQYTDEWSTDFWCKTLDLKKVLAISEEEIKRDLGTLENFWRRMGLVKAQNELLEHQKNRMIAKKEEYKLFIKKYTKTNRPEELRSAMQIDGYDMQPMTCGTPRPDLASKNYDRSK